MTITTTRPSKTGALRLGVAAVAATALTLAGTVSAVAADSQLGPDDITPYQIGDEDSADWNYNTWHIGSNDDTGASLDTFVTFGECSISTNVDPRGAQHHVQVLKGFDVDDRPTTEHTGDVSELQALIESISIDVAEGSVTLQLPIFLIEEDEEDPLFTTFRNSSGFGPGVHTLTGVELTDSQLGGLFDGLDYLEVLDTMSEPIDAGDFFQILGVGFTGSEGAVVNSISFAGDTYYFGTGDCVPADEDEDDEDDPSAPRPPERVDTDR